MSTFTRTPWVNGEIITADKLNSHNCKLEYTSEELFNGLTIDTGLEAKDFLGMLIISDNMRFVIESVSNLQDNWMMISGYDGNQFFYNTLTGIVQPLNPSMPGQDMPDVG